MMRFERTDIGFTDLPNSYTDVISYKTLNDNIIINKDTVYYINYVLDPCL